MSTKLGTLTLDLIAKTAGFTAPIKDAEKQTQSSFDKMRKHVNNYGLAVAGAAAGAVTALAAMAVDTANQAAELEIFAFRANTTTQEFQKMAVGAAAFGIEGDKLSDMMKDFNEKLGELTAIGAGGGVDFFEKIAMKTEGSSEAAKQLILDMQKLSGPEALQMYVDKLEEAGVTQQQMSFYLESMASDMTDLYPLLANGGEGMKLYGDMAERAGIIMTDQTIESAKELKDQVYMLDLQMQGAKNQLMQAVIPAFVDIAEAFLGGSEQGLQFEEVADGVAKTLKGLASVAIGAVTAIQLTGKALGGMAAIGGAVWNEMDWYEMNPLGLAKAAYEARGEIAALTSEIKGDMHETVMGAADRLDKMWAGGTSEKAKQLRGIRELSQGVGDTNSGLSELADKQNEAAKATKENTKAQNELNKAIELGNSLIYDFGDEQLRISEDLKKDLADIQSAALKPDAKARYATLAQMQADARKKLYIAELDFELNEHNSTEERKLTDELRINKLRLDAQRGLNKNEIELRKQALDERYAMELQKARFHAQNVQQTMRESIKGLSYGVDEIFAQATMSPQDYDRWSLENDRSNSQLGLKNERVRVEQDIMTSDAYSTDDERYDALLEAHQEYRDAMAAIDVDYHARVKDLEVQNYEDKLEVYGMLLSQAGTVWGSMTQMVKDSAGEQSGAYKAMFLMQQAIAIGQAIISTELAATRALELGPILGIPASTLVRGMGYASVGLIAGQTIAGMAHDGIDNIPKEGTWLLDKGERVIDSRTNADLKNMIANNNGGSPQININVPPGYTAEQSRGADGAVTIDIVERRIKQSWGNLSNPNSFESKQVQRNTTAGVKR
ncbi:hypothetical protein [Acinetobacter pseudolwoffii]|uniref:hypothetical protein n=1 Tax=Acinetobacter pseudolwoffii TaxID=2053287 RepID=UPI0024690217|nr:hypothetical protein [Acinetobacter pseudolwoffii]MDH5819496.1 hypothetical protein [Acinetobacter pseudolwoffii]